MQSKATGGYSLNYETGVMQPIPINSMNCFRSPDADPTTGCGIGEAGEAMFTITKTNSHAVAQPIAFHPTQDPISSTDGTTHGLGCGSSGGQASVAVAQPMVLMDQGGSVMNVEHDMVGTLRRETHGHEPVVMQPVAFQQTADCLTAAYGTKWNGNASATNGSLFAAQPIAFAQNQRDEVRIMQVAGALAAEPGTKQQTYLAQTMAVRRLTPVECERLQGFPDGYTNIPWRKKDESPDGPRYKALGNSWAVPNVRWIGQRIQKEIEKNDL
jgi:hypothetical protein